MYFHSPSGDDGLCRPTSEEALLRFKELEPVGTEIEPDLLHCMYIVKVSIHCVIEPEKEAHTSIRK